MPTAVAPELAGRIAVNLVHWESHVGPLTPNGPGVRIDSIVYRTAELWHKLANQAISELTEISKEL